MYERDGVRERVSAQGGELEEQAERLLRKKHQQNTENRDKDLKAKDGAERRGANNTEETKGNKPQ